MIRLLLLSLNRAKAKTYRPLELFIFILPLFCFVFLQWSLKTNITEDPDRTKNLTTIWYSPGKATETNAREAGSNRKRVLAEGYWKQLIPRVLLSVLFRRKEMDAGLKMEF